MLRGTDRLSENSLFAEGSGKMRATEALTPNTTPAARVVPTL